MAGKDNPTTSRGSSNATTKAQSKPGTSAATTAPNANNEEPIKTTSNALSTAKSAKIYLIENGLATTGMEYTIATLSNILMQISHNASPPSKTIRESVRAVATLLQDLPDKNTADAILTYVSIGLNSQLTNLTETAETISTAAKKLESSVSNSTTTITSAANNLKTDSERITEVTNELSEDTRSLILNIEAAIKKLPTTPAPQRDTTDHTNISAPLAATY
ncbi:hypothetical protein BD410DRAFT_842556 [Rickenella mellea]|uniref:Uncharacterized protein n=1 Tax=Rickenella mellea TaxID=50990 RepID=A0A4Y7PUY8_9AGAM|nr:hypothetical protein BD410DRAFT_842556 [Rickenella mellea]